MSKSKEAQLRVGMVRELTRTLGELKQILEAAKNHPALAPSSAIGILGCIVQVSERICDISVKMGKKEGK